MIYDNHEVITLEPIRYELAQISHGEIPAAKRQKRPRQKRTARGGGGLIDTFLRSGLILLIALAMFTAVNLIGFENFVENLRQVINSQAIEGFWVDAEFV